MVDMEDGAGIDYTIDNVEPFLDGDMIDTLHPNASGYDKMADEWYLALYNFLLPFAPPDVGDIPDQVIDEGSLFTTISLDDYVVDFDHPDPEILWTYSGNSELGVSINNRVATVTIADGEWNGSETITFRATDPGGLFNEDDVTLTVNGLNDQPVIQGYDTLSTDENTALQISLNHLTVADPDNTYPDDFTLTVYAGTNYSLAENMITPSLDFVGTLLVPVSVNDGIAESDIIDMEVTVNEIIDPDPDPDPDPDDRSSSSSGGPCFIGSILYQ